MTNNILRAAFVSLFGNSDLRRGRARWGETPSSRVGSQPGHGSAEPRPTLALLLLLLLSAALLGTAVAQTDMALQFNGIDEYVRIKGGDGSPGQNFGLTQMPTTEVTVEFWQKVNAVKNQATFGTSPDNTGHRMFALVPWGDGDVYWDFGNDGAGRLQYTPPVSIVGTWQHFALVASVSGNYMRIYRNGILEASKVGAASFTPGTFDLLLGKRGNGYNFGGQLDQFRIWNYARSATQIQADVVNGTVAGNEEGLVAYYSMEQYTIVGQQGTLNQVVDSTIRQNDGLWYDGVSLVDATRVPSTAPTYGIQNQYTSNNIFYAEGYVPGVSYVATPAVTTMVVTNLMYHVRTGTANRPGVELTDGSAGLNLTLYYSGGIWTNQTSGNNSAGLRVKSAGSVGDSPGGTRNGENAGKGYDPGYAAISSTGNIVTSGASSPGILAISQAGDGGTGEGNAVGNGGNGGPGGNASVAYIQGTGNISTTGSNSSGVMAVSAAGNGGSGGNSDTAGKGGSGAIGGDGGVAQVYGIWNIQTLGDNSSGIIARSLGGAGGNAGSGGIIAGGGGYGGGSGDGSTVFATSGGSIDTWGNYSHGIFAQSIGGFAGGGGSGNSIFSASGGSGGSAGSGGNVFATNWGTINTYGSNAHGIFAESVGGGGGGAGSGSGLFSGGGGDSSAGGNGGTVTAVNRGTIHTYNAFSRGIFAQSVGGSGGEGATAGGLFYSVGGDGGKGGNGNVVDVLNTGPITTVGSNASGIFAQSVGGGGGTGGGAVAVGAGGSLAIGGTGGDGGGGSSVSVTSFPLGSIATQGDNSHGIFAQSVGGGGGNGGFAISGAWNPGVSLAVAVGGKGGGGGSASNVNVLSFSPITTRGTNAHGIIAQSVGGGGGSGGFSIAVSGGLYAGALSLGGGGSAAGNGQSSVLSSYGVINTYGERSYGLFAQSVGGGGGDGGFSIAGAFGAAAVPVSLGGGGSAGGAGNAVTLFSSGPITTRGSNAHGIVAQSVGGGGGSGGFSIAASGGSAFAGSLSLGGSGSVGGSASSVNLFSQGAIITSNTHAYGILAQSVGGGGGDGGFSIAGAIAPGVALSVSLGGSGGGGGKGGAVSANNSGPILTKGELSHGLFAQSVGGGGGSGGFSISASLAGTAGVGFALGGKAGSGVDADRVDVVNSGNIETTSKGAHALVAQSVGGGGGSGGFAGTLAGGYGNLASVGVSVGGAGGSGGNGSVVTVNNTNTASGITTRGVASYGIFAQSVGGGGGDGGPGLAFALGSAPQSANFAVAVGGSGGFGGTSASVAVNNSSAIETDGSLAHGIAAQSIGGGGGNGGFSAAGTLSTSSGANFSISVGGSGGAGGSAGNVSVTNSGQITTLSSVLGDISGITNLVREVPKVPIGSVGILAQSIGGGGGNGGTAFGGAFSGQAAKSFTVSVGGSGGSGGFAGQVLVDNQGIIDTSGSNSYGILAQSIGGGGGNGGAGVVVGAGLGADRSWNVNAGFSLGGKGGFGNPGSNVVVNNVGAITTRGPDAPGIFAQSVGGGGGAGGEAFTAELGADVESAKGGSFALSIAVGGNGGHGGAAGAVAVTNTGQIITTNDLSDGIHAQSIGGGGGKGGQSRAFNFIVPVSADQWWKNNDVAFDFSVGGQGGSGNDGGRVLVDNRQSIATAGVQSRGIMAQSIGGGGGSGGAGILGSGSPFDYFAIASAPGYFKTFQMGLGGDGGGSGNADQVSVKNSGAISTSGMEGTAIFAQSIGGGGGIAQMFAKGDGSGGNAAVGLTGKLGIGGKGGAHGNGGPVDILNTAKLTTVGNGANGIFAQSVGGGGGVAGDVTRALATSINAGVGINVAREGGGAGSGGSVAVTNYGDITTLGTNASGIFVQSVGGGGGRGGGVGFNAVFLSFAGSVGGFGNSSNVLVHQNGNITNMGDNSYGIFAQSAGGNNGVFITTNIEFLGSTPVISNFITVGFTTNLSTNMVTNIVDGSAGEVKISVAGNIVANGSNAYGILAQSSSLVFGRGSNISINILSGTVQGGRGSGVGVSIADGANNTLTNQGTITSLGGTAILATNGNETIHNYGTVRGLVNLGAGTNVFNNYAGATWSSGTVLLDQGLVLSNYGTVRATNGGTGVFDIRDGTNVFLAGLIEADRLFVTNSQGRFVFNGGTLITRGGTISNGQDFVVGATAVAGPSSTFANSSPITINDKSAAAPYPSSINVNGLGSIAKVTVTVANLNHSYPYDVVLLLVGPGGQKVMLMSGAGGSGDVVGVNLTFDDAAATPIPDGTQITSGTYQPANYYGADLPAPAPAGPYVANLSSLNGLNPNGTWSLFVNDGFSYGIGAISSGWSLNLVTAPAAATWDVRSNAAPTMVAGNLIIGQNASNALLLVTNGGTVANVNGYLGFNSTASNNVAVITGINSLWTNSGTLTVGSRGSGNQLVVSNGGTVANGTGVLGDYPTANNNVAVVTGTNSFWNNSGALYVGNFGSGNQLVVSNGGTVANSGFGFIGYTADANNNVALVTGAGSLWTNGSDLYVGDNGNASANRLVVSNGGTVANVNGYLSGDYNSSNNVALVTGAGSRWNNSGNLRVGFFGNGNQLVVSNGGTVANAIGSIGYISGANSNVALVTGTNSLWTNSGALTVGYQGSGNQLVVSNGGVVANGTGVLGDYSTANNNVALVTGAGSFWNNSGDLYVGNFGSGNQLVVSNGGTVIATSATVGFNASSANNRVTVDGGTLGVTNVSGTGALDIRRGTNVLNAGLIVTDNLLLTNGGLGRFEFNGGTLVTRGGTVSNGLSFVVGASGTTTAILDVRANQPLTLNNDFALGANTAPAGNQLLITNGGTLSVTGVSYLGFNAGASNNVAVVTGAGSLWTNGGDLRIGNSGTGNQLVVSNGGVVTTRFGYLGVSSNANNNVAVVTGANSLWTNGTFIVGNSGSGNQVVVSNGGVVSSGFGRIGLNPAASNNVAVVTGAGSLWTINGSLRVGESGSGNQLVVSDGGTLSSFAGIVVGFSNNAANNRLTVQGGNLILTNAGGTGALDIRRGTNVFNAGLIVTDRLMLTNSAGFLDFNGGTLITRGATINNGQDFVVGRNSGFAPATWDVRSNAAPTTVAGSLVIGLSASNARLLVTNGGTVANTVGYLGANAGANNNVAVVTGTNSLWTNSSDLYVGERGSGNQLVVSNSGTVSAASVFLGYDPANSANNGVTVDGGNLFATNASGTGVLDIRRGNNVLNAGLIVADRLLLTNSAGFFDFNGGTLITRGATINNGQNFVVGLNSGFSNATWDVRSNAAPTTVAGNLVIGQSASNARLLLTNGGVVANASGYVGNFLGATNNLALVTGTNSRWQNNSDLYVGSSGSGNRLVVSNGGVVANGVGRLGYGSTANNNVAWVTGTNSRWQNNSDLYVGNFGSGNQLVVSNGGVVANGYGFLGYDSTASNNVAVVTGAGSLWTNSGGLYVGLNGSGNRLVVSNGGVVRNSFVDLGVSSTASNNVALITGLGSLWSIDGSLRVGYRGSGNQLVGSNGGVVASGNGYVGYDSTASNNVAVVTGAGSLWTNSYELSVGYNGSGNQLVVSNGGVVANGFGYLGYNAGANNNVALVTGTNSLWINSAWLYVGNVGSGNQLVVSNSGTVSAANVIVGFDPSSINNRVTVDGGNLLVTNVGGAALDIRRGTNVLNAGLIVADRLLLTNSAGFFNFNGGTLNVRSATVSNGLPFTVGNGTSNAALNFTGTGTRSFAGGLTATSNALVTLTNGTVDAGVLTMTGAGSAFTFNGGTLITRGGTVSNGQAFVVGASGTTAAILDLRSNAPLVLGNGFTLGANTAPAGNQLLITNGATLGVTGDSFLGTNATTSNNVAIVSGAGSRWTNSGFLSVGESGSGNRLVVSNGGTVSAANVIVGYDTLISSNNRVTVDGGNLLVTNVGGTAALDIRRGTNVLNAGLIVADRLLLTNNAGFFNFNGGTLVTRGGTISNSQAFVVGGQNPTVSVTASNVSTAFTNPLPISIFDFSPSSPYPSTINVSNVAGLVTKVTVTISNLSHAGTFGVSVLLVGPGGANVMLMSGAGDYASGATVTFDDAADNVLPFPFGTITSGTYLPADFGVSGDLSAPAPAGPYGTYLSALTNLNPNGAWSLFVEDFGTGTSGTIANGWSLNIQSSSQIATTNFTAAAYRMSGAITDAHSFANGLVIASGATLTGNGTITGSVTNFGTLAPGNSAGSIKINGSLSLKSSSMMSFEIGGLIATNDYDVVNVTNFVQFAGTLSLSLLNNFLPAPANSFTLVSFGSASGTFANISSGRVSLTNNLASFAVTQTATNLVLGGVTYTDTDGDGQGDLQEQAAGTDPAVSASVLRIVSVVRDGPLNLRVRFTVEPGKNHRIEWSSDLVNWNALTGPPTFTAGPPGTKEWLDDGSLAPGLNITTTRRFYRVGLQ